MRVYTVLWMDRKVLNAGKTFYTLKAAEAYRDALWENIKADYGDDDLTLALYSDAERFLTIFDTELLTTADVIFQDLGIGRL